MEVKDELLRFTNTCRASYWVVDTTGNVVFDSLDQANCRNAELDVVVGASSQSTFALQSWAFVDEVGCSMLSGDYVVIAEVSEFGYIHQPTLIIDGSNPLIVEQRPSRSFIVRPNR